MKEAKIIEALNAIDHSIITLNDFSKTYNGYIDRAARAGDDQRAKSLIKQKIGVTALIKQLDGLRANVELGAYTSTALSNLGKLPKAISSCNGLLKQIPDFAKLGKNISKIFSNMNGAQNELENLNDILSPAPIVSLESRLSVTDIAEETAEYKAEYAAMIDRIKPNVDSVITPSATGDLNIEGIIEEENKKK